MIKVEKRDFPSTVWTSLLKEAALGRDNLITSFDTNKKLKIDDRLYKRYMQFLLDLFRNKCAYCESRIGENQPGDVEHYRPKGRVVGDDLKPVEIDHPKKGHIQHPGYYWLAYDWSNLFPSCADCNRARHHGAGKNKAGKADRFPVEGFRAFMPGQERDERALLINPSEVDPSDHLEFMPDGTVRGRTMVGERTIKELGLNLREPLVEARRDAYREAVRLGRNYATVSAFDDHDEIADLMKDIQALEGGSAPFAAVRRLGFYPAIEAAIQNLERVRRPGLG